MNSRLPIGSLFVSVLLMISACATIKPYPIKDVYTASDALSLLAFTLDSGESRFYGLTTYLQKVDLEQGVFTGEKIELGLHAPRLASSQPGKLSSIYAAKIAPGDYVVTQIVSKRFSQTTGNETVHNCYSVGSNVFRLFPGLVSYLDLQTQQEAGYSIRQAAGNTAVLLNGRGSQSDSMKTLLDRLSPYRSISADVAIPVTVATIAFQARDLTAINVASCPSSKAFRIINDQRLQGDGGLEL